MMLVSLPSGPLEPGAGWQAFLPTQYILNRIQEGSTGVGHALADTEHLRQKDVYQAGYVVAQAVSEFLKNLFGCLILGIDGLKNSFALLVVKISDKASRKGVGTRSMVSRTSRIRAVTRQ